MKTDSLFETKLNQFRKEYLEEGDERQDQREIDELEKVDAKVRQQKLKNKKTELQKLKKQEQQAKQSGSQL
jgi:hypothetical protein